MTPEVIFSGFLNPNKLTGQKLLVTQLFGKSNPVQTFGSFTTPNDGIFHQYICFIGVNYVTRTSGVVNGQLVFTDENGTLQTFTITTSVGGLPLSFGSPIPFLTSPNTTVTLNTTGSFVGASFDVWGSIFLAV